MSDTETATSRATQEFETVNLSVSPEGAATIELNRPHALNAWNRQFGADLLGALGEVAQDSSIRALLITGAGRAFSSGADLKDFGGADDEPAGRPTSTRC